jgi:hypothetical protein
VAVDPAGLTGPTKAQASGPRWRRTSKGYYVPAHVSGDVPEQRILEQSMRLPPGGAVTGWAACRLLGAAFLDGLDPSGRTRLPVPLWVGDLTQLTADEHASVMRDDLVPDEQTTRAGIRCSRPLRAVFDAARRAPDVREAVVVIDMVAAAELISLRQLREYVAGRRRLRGVPKVRAALDRESRLRDVGLEVFRVTGADLRRRERLVARMHAARERALRTPPGHGAWTIEPPMDRAEELPLHDRLEQIAVWEQWEGESGAPNVSPGRF